MYIVRPARLGLIALAIACFSVASFPSAAHAGGISASVTLETLGAGERQFFDLGELTQDFVVFGFTTPIAGIPDNFDFPDTVMATFYTADVGPGDLSEFYLTLNDDSDGDNSLSSDDSVGSLFRLQVPETDSYTVGVTGYPDFFDTDPHSESGNYFLTTGYIDPTTTGGDFADTDASNASIFTPDLITIERGTAQVAVNEMILVSDGPGVDLDFYTVYLEAGDIFNIMTAPLGDLSTSFDAPDTIITVYDPLGNVIFDDDDAGGPESDFPTVGEELPYGSLAHLYATETGFYFFSISGHPEAPEEFRTGLYGLLVSRTRSIPEPASAALLAMAALAIVPRRRARQ